MSQFNLSGATFVPTTTSPSKSFVPTKQSQSPIQLASTNSQEFVPSTLSNQSACLNADAAMFQTSSMSFMPTSTQPSEGVSKPQLVTEYIKQQPTPSEFNPSFQNDDDSMIDIKFKSELCKNWSETGFCRYNSNCQFAHGVQELSSATRQDMESEVKNYKTQKCRQFWKEMFCRYGERCHFRHEQRSFKKLHRYFYCQQLQAVKYRQEKYLKEHSEKENPMIKNLQLHCMRTRLPCLRNLINASTMDKEVVVLSTGQQLSSCMSETLDSSVCSQEGDESLMDEVSSAIKISQLDSMESNNIQLVI